jgi:polysaccharide export outer membrane protein
MSITGVTLLLFVIGCGAPFRDHTADPIKGTLAVQTLENGAAPPRPYQIQRGDSLAIRFYRNPELNNDLVVRPDGMISLPLLDDVPAAGSSPLDLGHEIERRYQGELAVPDVTVIVTKFAGQRIWVGGEVGVSGELELVSGLTLLGAIQKAGGFKNSARIEQVILIRRGSDGHPRGTSLDLTEIKGGVHPERDVELEPYDVVVVPRSAVANVNTFMELYITRNLPAGGVWLNILGAGAF